ncbi:MAG: hypothetical protein M0Q51_14605 [Bacteroidales bacterium]|nr:hypothetical protein [Bacteroidales bacterium]
MKNQVLFPLVILISGALLFSCSKPIEKKLAGMWKVEDVQFNTNLRIDPGTLEASKESQKAISYELLEDFTAKVHAGFSVLEGNWIYKEAESSVYMVFSGTFDTILLGRYEKGKLINEETRPDITITTIFIKENKKD